MITSVVFDLDDTLCDYADAKRRALEQVCAEVCAASLDADAFLQAYKLMEPSLFTQFARGSLSRDEYRRKRFSDPLFPSVVTDAFLRRLNEKYMCVANEDVRLFDETEQVIGLLRTHGCVCAVLTNGPSDGQRKKMQRAGLVDLIPRAFVSEEIGSAKPQPEAFIAVAQALGHRPDQMIMVGDSIEDDVRAAEAVGMVGVLVDRHRRHESFKGLRVHDLRGLLAIIQRSQP
jgi:HAD superfamily hydrolase (TIGR01549 family)